MSFRTKLSINFIALLFIFIIFPAYFMCRSAIKLQKEDLRGKILDLSKLASFIINADAHKLIKPEKESCQTQYYKDIVSVLTKIRDVDPIVDSIYTMVKTEDPDIWMFMVDSGDRRGRFAYCGERYNISAYPQMKLAFDGPAVDKELTKDRWGVWLSSYAPIYDKEGNAVAMVGLDVSALSIARMQSLLYHGLILICLVGIIISLLASWFVSRNMSASLRELIEGVREVEQGNFKQKVKVKEGGEIQELANAFNKMTAGLRDAHAQLQQYYLDTIKALAQALEAKDHYTRGHAERVKQYAVGIAERLGFSKKDIELLEDVCILHDIGKIGVPEKILTKPGPLNAEEWQIVNRHPAIGEEILRPIEFLKPVLYIVSGHHERPDGKGYPNGLKGHEIPILAAIVSVADAFDAMTSDRPYRKAFSQKEALNILIENKDKQFNAKVIDTFVEFLKEQDSK